MQEINKISEIKNWIQLEKSNAKTIAFVPTMGGLHAGHLALVELAKKRADRVVVSIFVNPAQFSENEDFDTYPRTMVADLAVLKLQKVDVAFTPNIAQIYPNGTDENFDIGAMGQILCGKTRPHFFNGVVQVVRRLFEIVRPDVAVFGQKDYQQFKIIQAHTLGVEIDFIPIMRESDGLAMSTRNAYLSASQRKIAPQLYQILQKLAAGKLSENQARESLEKTFKLDYLEILDADTLEKINDNSHQIAILCAVFLDTTRLIDNIICPSASFQQALLANKK